MTVAVLPLVVFRLDDDRFGLPLDVVRRSIRAVEITALPGAPAVVAGIVDLAGVIVPVIDLRVRLGRTGRSIRLSDQLVVAVTQARVLALLVDETIGVLEVEAADVTDGDAFLAGDALVAGAVTLADGLVVIHDLERMLTLADEAAIDQAIDRTRTATADETPV